MTQDHTAPRRRASRLWLGLRRHGRRDQLPLSEGNTLQPLLSGCAILQAIREQIAEARRTIHLEIYAWADDATGRGILEALQAARHRGVQVRGIVDHAGSWGSLGWLTASGLDLRIYHRIGWNLAWRLWHQRNHRKLVLVDGTTAVVGSANWTDDYNCAINENCYQDLGLVLRGPVVSHLEADFARSWTRAGGHPVPAPQPPEPRPPEPGWHTGVAVQVVSTLNGGGRSLRRHWFRLLRTVQHRVLLANAYFIPDPLLRRLFIQTARRGVSVELVLPGRSDHPLVQAAGRATFGRLIRAGANLWERQDRMLHAKAALFDEDLVLVGSANLDARSFRHNLELNLLVRDRALAARLEGMMDEAKAMSHRLDLAYWSRLPRWRKLVQRFLYLLWPWL